MVPVLSATTIMAKILPRFLLPVNSKAHKNPAFSLESVEEF